MRSGTQTPLPWKVAGFVMVWSNKPDKSVHTENYISYRVFDNEGNAVTGQIDIDNAEFPEVTALAGGGFFIVWGHDEDADLVGQQFDASGQAVSDATLIETDDVKSVIHPDVAELENGNLLVVWRNEDDDVLSTQITPITSDTSTDGNDTVHGTGLGELCVWPGWC